MRPRRRLLISSVLQDASCASLAEVPKIAVRKLLESIVLLLVASARARTAWLLRFLRWANQALHPITPSSLRRAARNASRRGAKRAAEPQKQQQRMSGFRMSLGTAAPPQANDDAATFQQLLADMSGTKESIKQAKEWLLQRPDKAEVFAKALQKHVPKPGFPEITFRCRLFVERHLLRGWTKEDPSEELRAGPIRYHPRGPKPLQMINRETSLSK